LEPALSRLSSKSTARPGRPRDPSLPGKRREQIIRVATRLFAKHGYTGTDLQDVADVLKVGKGTLYRYFPSKRELFQGAVDQVMVDMRAAIDSAVADVDDPLDRIVAAIRSYLSFFHEHPEFVELLIQERAEFRDRKKPTYFVYREANASGWHSLYRDLIHDGRLRNIPVDRMTDVIGDLLYGTMFTNYISGRTRSLVEQGDDIVNVLFNGLLTAAERVRHNQEPLA
jgi:AcrR family transcriptional regulator